MRPLVQSDVQTVELPVETKKSPNKEIKSAVFYSLQVASFKDKTVAKQTNEKLLQKGYDSFVLKSKSQTSGTIWHMIFVGMSDSSSVLDKMKPELINLGYKDCFVKKISRENYNNNILK